VKKINLYITDEQDQWLIDQNEKQGLSGKSEVIRRILDKAREGRIKYVKASSD
jgi:hypothetical protein